MIPVGTVKITARARPKNTVPTLVLVGQAATDATPKATPTISSGISCRFLVCRLSTYVENHVPPLRDFAVFLHEFSMNILELVDLAVLFEALIQGNKSQLDIVPVVDGGIRDDRAVYGKEVDAASC